MSITATDFYNFVQCPHRVYLERFGPEERKLPASEFMQKKFEEGREHEKEIISSFSFAEVESSPETYSEAFRQTSELMKHGSEMIYQGVLISKNLFGIPDLLEKADGESSLGNFHYVPVDIKLGLHVKEEYVMQVMFYAFLLEKLQGKMPEKGFVILGNGKREEIVTEGHMNAFKAVLNRIESAVKGTGTELHICGACSECAWKEFCFEKAVSKEDVSLIFSLTKRAKELLNENGIETITQLSEADVEELANVKGLSEKTLSKWKQQAISLRDKTPITLNKPELPESEMDIYFDIEGETDLDVEYLWGLLIKNRNTGKEEYVCFVAERPEDEEKAWKEFLGFLKGFDAPVYHYHSYEKRAMKKMKEKYGCDEEAYEKATGNMIDLFNVVKASVVLPLYSYSIKPIAKYLGFKWRNDKAGGAQSMCWYGDWLEKKDDGCLDLIKEYNEDDCRATLILKEWLENL